MSTVETMLRIGTWNTQWAKPGTARGDRVSASLADPDCDILCVTEGYADILHDGGHVIDGGDDWGYPVVEGRRKVLLWSKRPWSDVVRVDSDRLPCGRFVAGTTQTDTGPLVVVGACIPWSGAHVNSGRRNRNPWQDRESWLAGFKTLRFRRATEKSVVLGDFNQRIPRSRQPKRLYEQLRRAFDGFMFATVGELAGAPDPAIDRIAHTPDMALIGDIGVWPRRNEQDKFLSDHFGVWGDFAPQLSPSVR